MTERTRVLVSTPLIVLAMVVLLLYNPAVDYSAVGVESQSVSVGPPTLTTTVVTCTPASIAIGFTSKCTATVSGVSSPAGIVAFTQSGTGSVTILSSPAICNLASGSCSVIVEGDTPGSVTITATYSGNPDNLGSSGKFGLSVT